MYSRYSMVLLLLSLALCTCYPSNECNCVPMHECKDVKYLAERLGKFDHVEFCNIADNKVCCSGNEHRQKQSISEKRCSEYSKMEGFCPPTMLISKPSTPAENEYPFMALIEVKNKSSDYTLVCGGALIDPMYILTASHCFDRRRSESGFEIFVRLGAYNRTSSGTRYKATETVHPDNSYDDTADISLLKLNASANILTNKVKPACIAQSSSSADGEYLVAGWGFIKPGQLADTLKSSRLVSVESNNCELHGEELDEKKQMCTKPKENFGDVCEADSGGPLFTPNSKLSNCLFEIFGIVSRGNNCNFNNSYSSHTKVFYYRDWIEKVVWFESL